MSLSQIFARFFRRAPEEPLRFTDAEVFIKWLCRFYNKPYPLITISKQRLDELNAKHGTNGDSLFVLTPPTSDYGTETREIVLQRRDIRIDKWALYALIEAGHHIVDFDNHIDRQPKDSEL